MPRSTMRLASPMASRKNADTSVPTMPPTSWKSSSWLCSAAALAAMIAEAMMTIDECPSEKKNPTVSGFFFSCMSLRTTLSMAAMWSASNAWRRPNT